MNEQEDFSPPTEAERNELSAFLKTVEIDQDNRIVTAEGIDEVIEYEASIYHRVMEAEVERIEREGDLEGATRFMAAMRTGTPDWVGERVYDQIIADIREGLMMARKAYALMRLSELLTYADDRTVLPDTVDALRADMDSWWEQRTAAKQLGSES